MKEVLLTSAEKDAELSVEIIQKDIAMQSNAEKFVLDKVGEVVESAEKILRSHGIPFVSGTEKDLSVLAKSFAPEVVNLMNGLTGNCREKGEVAVLHIKDLIAAKIGENIKNKKMEEEIKDLKISPLSDNRAVLNKAWIHEY